MSIKLGDRVKDKITGFQGIATGICDYITGCKQVLVTPEAQGNGHVEKLPDSCWLDIDRLNAVESAAFNPSSVRGTKRVGSMDQPPIK